MLIPDITALSLRARIALTLRLFTEYCVRRGLEHAEIGAYLDHMWRFLLVEAGVGFAEWMLCEPALVCAGLGDDLPPGFEALLADRGVPEAEFRQALCCSTEVLYGSMYAAADETASRRFLGELAELVAPLGIAFPDTRPFVGSKWSDGHGWGDRLVSEELAVWRGEPTA